MSQKLRVKKVDINNWNLLIVHNVTANIQNWGIESRYYFVADALSAVLTVALFYNFYVFILCRNYFEKLKVEQSKRRRHLGLRVHFADPGELVTTIYDETYEDPATDSEVFDEMQSCDDICIEVEKVAADVRVDTL